jgi:hypothetical protein
MMGSEQRFKIGTTYTVRRSGRARRWTVVDVWKTYNSAGELVKLRYVSEAMAYGQPLRDHDVCDTTIARALNSTGNMKEDHHA